MTVVATKPVFARVISGPPVAALMSVAPPEGPKLVEVLTETDEPDDGTTVYAAPLIDVVDPEGVSVSCGPPEGEITVTAPELPQLVVVLTGVEVAVEEAVVEA
jgi:hypothetical protein